MGKTLDFNPLRTSVAVWRQRCLLVYHNFSLASSSPPSLVGMVAGRREGEHEQRLRGDVLVGGARQRDCVGEWQGHWVPLKRHLSWAWWPGGVRASRSSASAATFSVGVRGSGTA